MMRYQVRFHLGAGKNYQHWQVKSLAGVQYHDPSKVSLTMLDCQLRNQPGVAKRIHGGGNKSVCAWIDCNDVIVGYRDKKPGGREVFYNPKVAPNWRDSAGKNVDGLRLESLVTSGRRVSVEDREVRQ